MAGMTFALMLNHSRKLHRSLRELHIDLTLLAFLRELLGLGHGRETKELRVRNRIERNRIKFFPGQKALDTER